MKIEEMVEYLEYNKTNHATFNGICIDCKCDVEVNVDVNNKSGTEEFEMRIVGGAINRYYNKLSSSKETQFKCDKCFEKRSYFQSRVDKYSRIVGYLRPVSEWHNSKKAEFRNRKMFGDCLNEHTN